MTGAGTSMHAEREWDRGERRCPSTTRHVRRWTAEAVGVQCQYAEGHDGDHCGYSGSDGHVFWPPIVQARQSPADDLRAAADADSPWELAAKIAARR